MKSYKLLAPYEGVRSTIINRKNQLKAVFSKLVRNYERTGSLDKFIAANDDSSDLEVMTSEIDEELRNLKYLHSHYKGTSYMHDPYEGRNPTFH